jgi:hypothetical protein
MFLAITTFCYSQNENSFSIEEVGLLGGGHSKYIYENNILSVFKNSKKIKTIKLSNDQKIKLDSIISKIGIENLYKSYEVRSLTIIIDDVKVKPESVIMSSDGINWYFNFKYGGKEKNVFLNNYYIEKLDILVRYLNSLLNKKSRIISFGNMYLEPDTVIYYLPEFMFEGVDADYMEPNTCCWIKKISLYRNGHFVTQFSDSTKQYYYRKAHSRSYWMIYRLKDMQWKNEYYDKSEKPIKVVYLKDMIPFEIKNEVITKTDGIKPSVVICKYFKTETIEKQE